jgi:hypothetical protein
MYSPDEIYEANNNKKLVIIRKRRIKFIKSYPSIFFAIEFAGVGEENSASRHVETHSKRLGCE